MPYIRAAGLTHRGAVRASNEDCIAMDGWISQLSMATPFHLETTLDQGVLYVVADGMGGHAAGEVASEFAVLDLVEKSRRIGTPDQLKAVLTDLNQALFDKMKERHELAGMGTTVAGIILREREAFLFNIGDSRIYVDNGGYLRLLSTDDTSAATSIGSHERTGQFSHALLQCLGGARAFMPVSPHVTSFALPETAAARFLLCSDGLTDMLDQDAIEACLQDDPAATAKALFEAAMAEGGQDNFSVVVVDYSGLGLGHKPPADAEDAELT
jgi:serine/threonine protein phosphatase PrpC